MRSALLALLAAAPVSASGNVLLIIADDVGIDRVAVYGEHPTPGPTPVIDQLAADGVLFRNCWSTPQCSPTRATILTGRHPFRTGLGWFLNKNVDLEGLSLDEWTLPELILVGTQGQVRTAHLGKWHLGGLDQKPLHPNMVGFSQFAGSWANLPLPDTYFDFEKIVNGTFVQVSEYATTDTVEDTLRVIDDFDGHPWFITASFNAAHTPYHAPPPHLHTFVLSGDPKDTPIPHHKAMVQALDTEIGRLLQSMNPATLAETTIIFVGDNGTEPSATEPPWLKSHGKASVFEGGINVPLIIAGYGVSAKGRECAALVQTTDIYSTVAALVGVGRNVIVPHRLDSISMKPYLSRPNTPSKREFAYAEQFRPIGDGPYDLYKRAARGERYKLHVNDITGQELFFDLLADPLETNNLLPGGLTPDQVAAYDQLDAFMDELLASK